MRLFSLCFVLLVAATSFAQSPRKATASAPALARPKLVVGIVVDQMRYDYLYRYYDKYSTGGFRRLMDGDSTLAITIIIMLLPTRGPAILLSTLVQPRL